MRTIITHAVAAVLGMVLCTLAHRSAEPDKPPAKIERSDQVIPPKLAESDVDVTEPDVITIFSGGGDSTDNAAFGREVARLEAEYRQARAQYDSLEAGLSMAGERGEAHRLSPVGLACSRHSEADRAGLKPVFQTNAAINSLLAVFAREQSSEFGLAEHLRFVLLPYSMSADRPVVTLTPDETAVDIWDPLAAGWRGYSYRHSPRPKLFYVGAGAVLRETGVGYGPSVSIDHRLTLDPPLVQPVALRASAEIILDVTEPRQSVATSTIGVGI